MAYIFVLNIKILFVWMLHTFIRVELNIFFVIFKCYLIRIFITQIRDHTQSWMTVSMKTASNAEIMNKTIQQISQNDVNKTWLSYQYSYTCSSHNLSDSNLLRIETGAIQFRFFINWKFELNIWSKNLRLILNDDSKKYI